MHCRARIRTDSAKIANYKEEIMAQLWGGRFTKETDKLVYNFNASISFDQKFINRISAEVKLMSECWPSRAS